MKLKHILSIIGIIGFGFANSQNSGDLDLSFNNDGFVRVRISTLDDYLSDVLINSNGDIIGLGTVYEGWSTFDFALTKLTQNGNLDLNFADNGIHTTTQVSTSSIGIIGALQVDEKIVATGRQGGGFAVVRYNSDGSLDNSFSDDGKLFVNALSNGVFNFEIPSNIKILNDGKIMVIGRLNDGWGNNFTYLSRINSNGTLDTNFGTMGNLIFSDYVSEKCIFMQNGDIITAVTENSFLKIKKYSVDGQIDSNFGNSGEFTIEIEQNITVGDIIVDELGNAYVTGHWSNDSDTIDFSQSWMLKINAYGTIDSTFGTNGLQLLSTVNFSDSENEYPRSLLIIDGLLYVGGHYNTTYSSTSYKGYIACFDLNGNTDSSFGTNGLISLGSTLNVVKKIREDANGKILIAGDDKYSDDDFMFARIHTNSSLSVEDVRHEKELITFPNPVDRFLNIELKNDQINHIIIYNTLGQIIDNVSNINNNSYTITMDTLQKGLYFISIENKKGVIFHKKVLKK